MKKLLELEGRLIKAQEELKKYIQFAGEHGGSTKHGKKAASEAKNKWNMSEADHYHYELDDDHDANVKEAVEHFKEKGDKHKRFHEDGPALRSYLDQRKATAAAEAKAPIKKMDDMGSDVNCAKAEHCDEKEDEKLIEEKIDEHNEEKHGEPKDKDSAKKSDCDEMLKFGMNGQWSIMGKDESQ